MSKNGFMEKDFCAMIESLRNFSNQCKSAMIDPLSALHHFGKLVVEMKKMAQENNIEPHILFKNLGTCFNPRIALLREKIRSYRLDPNENVPGQGDELEVTVSELGMIPDDTVIHRPIKIIPEQMEELRIKNRNFTSSDFSNFVPAGKKVIFTNCNFSFVNFDEADLRNVDFIGCTFAGNTFNGAIVAGVDFSSCVFKNPNSYQGHEIADGRADFSGSIRLNLTDLEEGQRQSIKH